MIQSCARKFILTIWPAFENNHPYTYNCHSYITISISFAIKINRQLKDSRSRIGDLYQVLLPWFHSKSQRRHSGCFDWLVMWLHFANIKAESTRCCQPAFKCLKILRRIIFTNTASPLSERYCEIEPVWEHKPGTKPNVNMSTDSSQRESAWLGLS